MKLPGYVPNSFIIYVHVRSAYFSAADTVHECRNWERGRAVSFMGICVSIFRYSVYAVYPQLVHVQIIHYKIIKYGSICSFLPRSFSIRLWEIKKGLIRRKEIREQVRRSLNRIAKEV
jgi:hypothetical protein